jgi:hypothetical protein
MKRLRLLLQDAQLLIRERREWVASAAVGALLFWIASVSLCAAPEGPAPAPHASTPRADVELAALQLALDREVEARAELAREVASLREQIAGRGGGAEQRSADFPPRAGGRRAFDPDTLVAAGVAPRDAQALRERLAVAEMDKIRLNDRATREGWADTPRYEQERTALDDQLREQLSEVDYDRYLYATGRSNRARVTDMLSHAPGDDAGFQPGDVILSYGGERVFNGMEIGERSTRRRSDELIPVEVLRNHSTLTLNVRGGPLGLVFAPDYDAPR